MKSKKTMGNKFSNRKPQFSKVGKSSDRSGSRTSESTRDGKSGEQSAVRGSRYAERAGVNGSAARKSRMAEQGREYTNHSQSTGKSSRESKYAERGGVNRTSAQGSKYGERSSERDGEYSNSSKPASGGRGSKSSNRPESRGNTQGSKYTERTSRTISAQSGKQNRPVAAKGNVKVASAPASKVVESVKNSNTRRVPRKNLSTLHEKNETVQADIIGITHDGEGVGRTSAGYTLFIPNTLPGEQVEAKILKSKKQYGYAKVMEFKKLSEQRVDPPCPIYKECGGCQLQHFDYEGQLVWKRQHVIDSLTRIGKLQVADEPQVGVDGDVTTTEHQVIVHPTVGMDNPWRYRNKAAVPIGRGESSEELVGGFYAKGSHRIVDMKDCMIQKERNDEVIHQVKEIARELRMLPYDEETGTGILRHVVTRIGVVTGEVMVVLITNTTRIARQPEWIEHIRKRIPNVKSIVHNVNDKVTNAIFGETTKVIWGSEVIYDELDGIRFAISARSFYQVNPEQTISLYRKAVEYAGLTGKEQVIDAYCGIGTISLFLARNAGHVYGVEIVPEAIEDAKRNAKLNGLENTTFEAGPAEIVIPRWKKKGMKADVIVVDPPRKGCDAELLDTILAIRPERVVYVSCNPSTLARDLRLLEDGGYRTVEVTPVDMFPHTGHVEVVTWLVRI